MSVENWIAFVGLALTIVGTLLGVSWKLHNEMSSVKLSVEKLLIKFEQVEKIEKRVERLEKKVFRLDLIDHPPQKNSDAIIA